MRAVETTPAVSLNAGEKLSWVLVRRAQLGIHRPSPCGPSRTYRVTETTRTVQDCLGKGVRCTVKQ